MSALAQPPVRPDTQYISKNLKIFTLKSAIVRIWRTPLVCKMSALDNPHLPLTADILHGRPLIYYCR